MKLLRWLLLPFSLLYGLGTGLRNWLYNKKVITSWEIPVKSIVVGNLSVGGTGKSPLVVYLIQQYLQQNKKVATLSRGYGRSTKGVRFAKQSDTVQEIGDEPLQYKTRFDDRIQVIVAEKRVDGAKAILEKQPDTEIILLDDAFQHRAVSAGLNILVTKYDAPFSKDFLLPTGNLRESKSGASRADVIIVSKCPESISQSEKDQFERNLCKNGQKIFFSTIKYGDLVPISNVSVKKVENILLVTGIATPEPLIRHLESQFNLTHLKFADHHDFTDKDIKSIHQKFNTFASRDKIIVTTEKDFMRLRGFSEVTNGEIPWFYQPIEVTIDNEEEFNNLLNEYVR